MEPIQFVLNGEPRRVAVAPEMPLLWVLRDVLSLTGTKFGCGMSLCGACTVHLEGAAIRSCVTPTGSVAGRSVTTIEGLAKGRLHVLQQAFIDEGVPQCGYCQPGQIMSAAALLQTQAHPSEEQVDQALAGNLCRCGTYQRIRAAVLRASHGP